jgi:hypothetical protein
MTAAVIESLKRRLTCIRNVPGTNRGQVVATLRDIFKLFPQFLQTNAGTS